MPFAHWKADKAHTEEYLAVASNMAKFHAEKRDIYCLGGEMWVTEAGDAGGGPSSGTQPGAQVPADAARANGMPPEIGGKRGGSDPAIPVAVVSVEGCSTRSAPWETPRTSRSRT